MNLCGQVVSSQSNISLRHSQVTCLALLVGWLGLSFDRAWQAVLVHRPAVLTQFEDGHGLIPLLMHIQEECCDSRQQSPSLAHSQMSP